MNDPTADRRSKLEAAFRRLPIRMEAEGRMPAMVDILNGMPSSAAPPAFEVATRAATIKDLASLEHEALALAGRLDSLRGPAIDALAASGFVRQPALQGQLRQMAESARYAKELNIPDSEARGRKEKKLPSAIADILACNYRSLTGVRPTVRTRAVEGVAYGPFLDLVGSVFEAMGIDANPEVYAKPAVARARVSVEPMEEIDEKKG